MLQMRYDWGTQQVLFLAGLDKQDLNLGKLLMNWAGGGQALWHEDQIPAKADEEGKSVGNGNGQATEQVCSATNKARQVASKKESWGCVSAVRVLSGLA